MALQKMVLQNAILVALDKQAAKTNETDDPAVSRQELAADLATAFDLYVRTGQVITTVIGTSPGGAVTGTGQGTII